MPASVNDCFRFSKYDVGGHFQPHMDGLYVSNRNCRSVFTLLIYLNDDFSGGNTKVIKVTSLLHLMFALFRFVSLGVDRVFVSLFLCFFVCLLAIMYLILQFFLGHEGKATDPHSTTGPHVNTLDVKAEAGKVLLFNHDVFHQGSPVTKGCKYIVKTDVMFIRLNHGVLMNE